jgi:hypothetical protein
LVQRQLPDLRGIAGPAGDYFARSVDAVFDPFHDGCGFIFTFDEPRVKVGLCDVFTGYWKRSNFIREHHFTFMWCRLQPVRVGLKNTFI